MADGATVDPLSLHVVFGGHRISGRAKGQSVGVVYNVEQFQALNGVDNEGFRVKNNDLSARITVTLLQSAFSNFVLSSFFNADLAGPSGLVLPLGVVEQNGRTVYSAARAWITKMADGTWSDGGEVRVWTLETNRLIGVVGDIAATPINPDQAGPQQ